MIPTFAKSHLYYLYPSVRKMNYQAKRIQVKNHWCCYWFWFWLFLQICVVFNGLNGIRGGDIVGIFFYGLWVNPYAIEKRFLDRDPTIPSLCLITTCSISIHMFDICTSTHIKKKANGEVEILALWSMWVPVSPAIFVAYVWVWHGIYRNMQDLLITMHILYIHNTIRVLLVKYIPYKSHH